MPDKDDETLQIGRLHSLLFSLSIDTRRRNNPEDLLDRVNLSEQSRVVVTDGWTIVQVTPCLLYTSPRPRDRQKSRMPSSA